MSQLPNPLADIVLKLDNQFCFVLHAAARSVVRAYRPLLVELDLTYSQYLVLLVAWEWDLEQRERPTVTAMGARLDLDSGTLTPLLRRLEHKGLLQRERSHDDERELFVRVTEKGRALKERAAQVPLSLVADPPLPLPELLQMREQLKRLHQTLSTRETARADA